MCLALAYCRPEVTLRTQSKHLSSGNMREGGEARGSADTWILFPRLTAAVKTSSSPRHPPQLFETFHRSLNNRLASYYTGNYIIQWDCNL